MYVNTGLVIIVLYIYFILSVKVTNTKYSTLHFNLVCHLLALYLNSA